MPPLLKGGTMGENSLNESAAHYQIALQQLSLPTEWQWLKVFPPGEQMRFLQEILNSLARAHQSGDWNKVRQQIADWKDRAEIHRQQTAEALRQSQTAGNLPPEIASLLGKYRGRLSSVDEFLRNKQVEKSLEKE